MSFFGDHSSFSLLISQKVSQEQLFQEKIESQKVLKKPTCTPPCLFDCNQCLIKTAACPGILYLHAHWLDKIQKYPLIIQPPLHQLNHHPRQSHQHRLHLVQILHHISHSPRATHPHHCVHFIPTLTLNRLQYCSSTVHKLHPGTLVHISPVRLCRAVHWWGEGGEGEVVFRVVGECTIYEDVSVVCAWCSASELVNSLGKEDGRFVVGNTGENAWGRRLG